MTEKILIEVIPVPDEQESTFQIKMSDSIFKKLGLENQQKIELYCSRNSIIVDIVSINESEPVMQCTNLVLRELQLPTENFSIMLFKKEKGELEIGPVVGLLTEVVEKNNRVGLGTIAEFCEELSLYANEIGVLFYVFSLNTFYEQKGYIYIDGIWKKSNVPYPHVVHNRIHSRKREQSLRFIDFTTELQMNNVPYFNDHFLNKWEVHEILRDNNHLHSYMPDTMLLTSKDVLFEMLEKYKCVFVKPVHGSQGRNIFRIQKTDEATYYLDYTTFSGDIETIHQSFASLFQSLFSRLKQHTFIVQQCIPLLLFKEKPLDFRVLCQKQSSEKWQLTSIIARVSSNEDFVSNLARGGEIQKVNHVLLENFDVKEIPHIKRLIKDLALEVAEIIDGSADGIFAELGIDLALDQNGKPSIIEVNTKPSKNLDQEKLSTKIRPSAKALIHHCVFLSNLI
ncbi:YheC/YheD family endospore coat-associated protein [Bacillus timonensis]|uniref:YheC/YheD family endospore coat-associated protein n=1 Tax=Bacillus timonensis TaxID=1033734 RepID=UPI0002898A7A|nr:YheC/YheD family protein [Bacillus timonensis]